MLKGFGKQTSGTGDLPSPGSASSGGSASPGSPGYETMRPRKKLSFKEPEIFGYCMKLRKPGFKPKPVPELTFDEHPFEEENDDIEELESQAMRVVRTVGQAFEVCHKLSLNSAPEDRERGINRDGVRDPLNNDDDYEDHDETNSERPPPTPPPVHKDISLLAPAIDAEDTTPEITSSCISRSQEAPVTTASTTPIRQSPSQATMVSECGMLVGGELTALKHEIQLLRERLEQQGQQTRAAVAHARLLQDQLAAETAARIEAQTRTHQLLVQNKELLEHISALVAHLREQERLGGVGHITGPTSQGPQSAPMSTAPTVPDLSTLGQQSQRPGGPASPWELDPPSFSYYTYPTETVYTPNTNAVLGSQGFNSSNEQLQFQTQLLERLHNISPYQPQPQRSPYATPSPYPVGPGLLLPPTNNRPSSSAQVSPNSTSLRVSQANSYSPSPVMLQRADNYASSSLESSGEEQQHGATFIKPLPQGQNNPSGFLAPGDIDGTRIKVPSVTDEPPPIVLDPPPPGRRSIPGNKSAGIETANINNGIRTRRDLLDAGGPSNTGIARPQEPQKHLVHFLRTPGPPPSRTTSARLPSRSELMNQVQRTTWARHTTK